MSSMAKVRKNPAAIPFTNDLADDVGRTTAIQASSSETAEYAAQMTSELMIIAKSSADYIASMTCELSTLAPAQLERLGGLLDLVRREAESSVV
jgi:hypothetical protein